MLLNEVKSRLSSIDQIHHQSINQMSLNNVKSEFYYLKNLVPIKNFDFFHLNRLLEMLF